MPVEVTIRLLLDAIKADGGKRFLVDGFPRNTDNLAGWHRVVGDSLELAGILLYDCPEDVMEARLLERGLTSGRSDDNVESIRKRFKTFKAESMPVLQYYEQMGMVSKIDGTRPIEEVWADSQAFALPASPSPMHTRRLPRMRSPCSPALSSRRPSRRTSSALLPSHRTLRFTSLCTRWTMRTRRMSPRASHRTRRDGGARP